ncbi:MAG TPA: Rne/Rng family ribonuclease [Candidatus Omnitrophota bacterium]|nr:Rne/Rng family ribonuclease [Candidatus Omnitrophota bacterium]
MSKEILVNIKEGETRVAIIESGVLEDFYIERESEGTLLGNIYKGRVESILPSINAAFVNIGQEKNGFLYLTDIVNPLVEEELSGPRKFIEKILNPQVKPKETKKRSEHPPALSKGDEIIVQVVKEPFGTKGARLTSHVSLPGRFVVFMPYDKHLGVSKRIDTGDERHRLRELLKDLDFAKNSGFIIRTVALDKGKREIVRDAKFLYEIWQKIRKQSEGKQAPALLYKEYDLVWRIVRDFLRDDIDSIIVDSQEAYHRIRKFVFTLIGNEMINRIQHYRGEAPLFEAKNITKQLNKIYETKVYLKSGAYVVIEPTEGLTVVDVNSGRFKVNASPEDAAFMVNMEAATEIARQLRLRDLGGIIVIDFIDMNREGHKRQVLQALEKALEKDHAKTELTRISQLGLLEMTRARTGKTIQSMSFSPCPYCQGRGQVKTG